jgi:hypothetical protein
MQLCNKKYQEVDYLGTKDITSIENENEKLSSSHSKDTIAWN